MDLALIIYNGWCAIKLNQTNPENIKTQYFPNFRFCFPFFCRWFALRLIQVLFSLSAILWFYNFKRKGRSLFIYLFIYFIFVTNLVHLKCHYKKLFVSHVKFENKCRKNICISWISFNVIYYRPMNFFISPCQPLQVISQGNRILTWHCPSPSRNDI